MSTALALEIAAGIFLIIVGGFGFGWFRILKETNTLLRQQNTDLKTTNDNLHKKHEINASKIAKLEGQQEVLVHIPLRQIADHMDAQNKHMEAQTKLMDKLLKQNGVRKHKK